ncbi:MAG: hypothetical protein ACI4E4_01725 [Acetatifactor sp.]
MKRLLKRIGALALCTVVFAGSTMVTCAKDRSYTYNYDFWEDVQDSPDFYTVGEVYTSKDFGLETRLKAPQGLFVRDNFVYICDTGNNRIIKLEKEGKDKFDVVQIIDEFYGIENNTFSGPTDVAVNEEGEYFIADKGNSRVVKLDKDLNFMLEFVKPDDSTLDEEIVFQPNKLAIDTAGRVYCISTGINKGLIKYENDGTFSGFVGATRVSFDWTDYIQKKLATQAQREKMVSFVPTEYDNIYMDSEGFVYACAGSLDEDALRSESADALRRLNLMGNDILVRNGDFPIYGDLYWGEGGGIKGPSYFADVTALDNKVAICLDKNRGRIFGYDDQGKMMFAFGGNGGIAGYFRQNAAVAIEHIDNELLVLDQLDCSITVFRTTEFGETVYKAMKLFDDGEYDASGEAWTKAMQINGNYDLAYIGIGRSLLRQEKYREAMDYFELKYDEDNYSKAFKQYRKQWVEDHIGVIVVVLVLLFAIPGAIGKVKSIKHEIEIADIFKLQ